MFGLNRDKLRMVFPARLSWLQGAVLWFVIISFSVFGIVAWGMGDTSGAFATQELAPMVEVDGRSITRQAFLRRLRQTESNYRESFGEQADAILKSMNVRQQVLNAIVDREVALREARRAGLRVSANEVRDHIVATYVDEQGKFYGREVMSRIAAQNQYTEKEFRQQLADDLLVEKLRDFVKASALVTDAEVRAEYLQRNDRAKLDYISLDPNDLAKDATADDAELRAIYNADPQRFAVEERKAAYVVFAANEFTDGTDPTEDEVRAAWEREAEVRFQGLTQDAANTILRTELKQDRARQQARERASDAMTRFRDSGDIAALAAESQRTVHESGFFSQAATPAALDALDGDLTGLERALFSVAEMGKLAAFPSPVGDSSVVVQWLDKRGPVAPPFELAREAVLRSWRADRGEVQATELAAKLRIAIANEPDLAGAANANGVEVKQSPAFARTAQVPGFPESAELAKLAYQVPLNTPQETQVNGIRVFFAVTERFEMNEAKFAEERGAVRSSLEQRRQNEDWQALVAAQRRDLEARSKVHLTPLAAELVAAGPDGTQF